MGHLMYSQHTANVTNGLVPPIPRGSGIVHAGIPVTRTIEMAPMAMRLMIQIKTSSRMTLMVTAQTVCPVMSWETNHEPSVTLKHLTTLKARLPPNSNSIHRRGKMSSKSQKIPTVSWSLQGSGLLIKTNISRKHSLVLLKQLRNTKQLVNFWKKVTDLHSRHESEKHKHVHRLLSKISDGNG